MTVTGVFSLHGSPGATTTALALAARLHAHHGGALLVEADPTGGVLAARHDLSLTPNLLDAAAAARRTLPAEHLDRFVQQVPAGPGVVIAHPSSVQTCAALRAGGSALAALVGARSEHVVVDLGRWCPDGAAHGFVTVCSRLIVVMRPALEQIVQLLHLLDSTFPVDRLGVVVIGRQRFSARQIVEVSGLPSVRELPDDQVAVRTDPCAAVDRPRARWAAHVRELAGWCV